MSQQISPFLEGKYGWNYGENGWNLGADENWLKFSYLHDGNVDSIVSSLPAASNGAAHFLTTDNRFYFSVGTTWYSSPCPKWFIFKIKSTGVFWQFDGASAVEISNPTQANAALEALQDVVADLGTAAFEAIEFFATQSELDVASAQANDYTDTLRTDLANTSTPTSGSSLIGYRGRALQSKLDQWIDVRDFGAIPDYNILTATGTDNTTAFQSALDYIESIGGGVLYIPSGKYRITSALSIQDVPLVLRGDGMDTTMIILTTAAANLLNFTSTVATNRVDGVFGHGGPGITLAIHDVTLGTTVAAERCINVIMTPYTNSQPFLTLENVSMRSVLSALIGFKYAVHGYNLNGIKIDNVFILGDATNASADTAQPFYCEAAIRLTGDESAGFISHFWKGLTVYAYNRAVHCSNHYEGFYIQQFEFVHVSQGVYFDVSTCTNLHLENGHIDFKENGIYAEHVNGFHSVNVDYLKQGGAPLTPLPTVEGHCIGINLCQEFSIEGGRVWGFTSANNSDGILIGDSLNYVVKGVIIGGLGEANNGISIISTQGGNISGCVMSGVGVGIDVSGGADALHISDNTILNLVGLAKLGINIGALATNCTIQNNDANVGVNLAVNNQGSSNYLSGNTGIGAISSSFVDGDTSPNVHITGARTFTTANTGATSITEFDNGFVGLEINVIALDANTTIVHAAAVAVPIVTKSGANIVMALNSSAKFVRGPGAWYEV